MKNLEHIKQIAFALAIAAPATIVLWVIYHFGVNVPFLDHWDLIQDLDKIYSGQYTFGYLFRQHSEHRVVFPRLAMLALARFSHWNVLYEVYTNWILILCTWFMLWDLLRKTLRDAGHLIKPLAILHALLLFSFSQGGNLIWGWQIQWYLTNFSVIASIWSLYRWKSRWIGVVIGALGAIVASYSQASGQVIWVLGFISLVIDRANWKRSQILFWLVTALISLVGFYFHYETYQSRYLSFYRPMEVLQLIFALTGSPFGVLAHRGTVTISAILGWFGLFSFAIATVWILKNEKEDRFRWIPWLVLAGYGLSGVMLTAFGRIEFGLKQTAIFSRYTIFAILFWLGAIVPLGHFVVSQFRRSKLKIQIAIGLCILLYFVGYFGTAYVRYNEFEYFNKTFELGKLALYDAEYAKKRDFNALAFLEPEEFRWKTKFLESHRLGPFIEGSSSEILAKINEEWLQKINLLNLKGVLVLASSLSLVPGDVYKTDHEDSMELKIDGKGGANFDVHLNKIPHWQNSKPQKIFLFESQVAKQVKIHCTNSNGMEAFTVYGIPTSQHGRVFRWTAPQNLKELRFRLDYFIDPPIVDQVKVICFLSPI